MAEVLMYSTDPCPYCRNAKALLDKRGIAFEEVSLARDPETRAQLAEKTGMMTFPVIMIDGELLGGFTELAKADKDGTLMRLVEA